MSTTYVCGNLLKQWKQIQLLFGHKVEVIRRSACNICEVQSEIRDLSSWSEVHISSLFAQALPDIKGAPVSLCEKTPAHRSTPTVSCWTQRDDTSLRIHAQGDRSMDEALLRDLELSPQIILGYWVPDTRSETWAVCSQWAYSWFHKALKPLFPKEWANKWPSKHQSQ